MCAHAHSVGYQSMTTQTQASLDALAAQITQIVNVQVPGGELFSGVAYPITFDVGDVNVENFGSLTDKDGNTWTLTPGAEWWYGGIAENGTPLWTGYNVALRLVNGDAWVEEAKFGGWWNLTVGAETNNLAGRPDEGPDPGQSTAGTGSSGSSTGVITPSVGSVSPPTPPTGTQTQASLDALAAQITQIVNVQVPGGELFSGVAYPITFDVGDVNVENFGSLTDKDGNTWTLTPGAEWWYGGIAENGTQLWTGYNVALRLVNGDAWVEEAKFGGWWNLTVGAETNNLAGRPDEGPDPGQSTAGTGSSGSSTGVITPSVGSVSPPTPPTGTQTQASLDALAAQITQIVNVQVPGGELFSGVAYPITFDVGDVNVENFGSLTDKDGNTWTLTPGAEWWYGGIAENGTPLWTGYNVALRLVNGDAWVEEAKFGGWWNLTVGAETNNLAGRPDEGPDPGQSTAGTGSSGSSTGVITPSVGSVSPPTPPTGTQTQASLDALAAQITQIVNVQVPGGELFSGVAYPITFDVGDVNVENFGSLTDKDGNTWTLTPGAEWWYGGIAENGTQLWTGYNVALRLVNGDAWVEEAKFGGWWNLTVGAETNNLAGRPDEGPDPGQSTAGTGSSGTTTTPSTDFITPGVGSFKDAAGNTYTIDAVDNADENGAAIPNGSGTAAMEYYNSAVYGEDAGTSQWYTWNQTTWSAAAAPPSPSSGSSVSGSSGTGGGTTTTAVTTGTGSDALVLSVSEDAYANGDGTSDANGDAAFTVSVDGKQLAGTFYATASHSAGASQAFTFKGNWAPGAHTVTVAFLNDAYAGTPSTDRNLYVSDVTYDGTDTKQSAALMSTGSQTFSVTDSTAIPPVVTGGGSDSLVVKVSEDYYLANTQFTVLIDGKQLGGTFTATTLHSSGNSQTFAFAGDFGSGQHTVSVDFLNDAYAGTPSTDRNLYVNDIVYNGSDTGQSAALMSQGAKTFLVSGGTTPSVFETGDHGSLQENLSQTGTYSVGGDTFVLGSGNAATVTLGTGASQIKFVGPSSVTLTGGAGQAAVSADAGNSKFVAGAGSLEVTGGAGKDAYVFHTTSGLLTLEDFSLAKGDTLTIDKSLQGSLHEASDGVGGTMLSFGTTGHGVDIHGLAALPSSNIVWA